MAKSAKQSRQDAFLAAFVECACVSRAAKASNVSRNTHYGWLSGDPSYAERFGEARRQAVDTLLAEAIRRGKDGQQRMKFFQGKPIMVPLLDDAGEKVIDPETGEPKLVAYTEHEYSDTLLIFLLKAADPKRFNDRLMVESQSKIEHQGPGIDIGAVVREMHQDQDYVDWLTRKACQDAGMSEEDLDQMDRARSKRREYAA